MNGHKDPKNVVAMIVLPSYGHYYSHSDGEAIFNPLIDAPPTPPLRSYQHSSSYPTTTTTTTTTSTIPPGDQVLPNYYYSSQHYQQHHPIPQYSKYCSAGFDSSEGLVYHDYAHEMELQRRRQRHKQQCRTTFLVIFLLLLSWQSRHRRLNHEASVTGFNFDDTGSDITTDDTIENQNLADDEVFVDVNNSNSSKATLASDHSNLSD